MDKPVDVCILCENKLDPGAEGELHTYTSDPCYSCKQEIKQGNYIFILISDKSDKTAMQRLHKTWVVEPETDEEREEFKDQFNGEHIVFIREKQAMKLGLLEERVTDEETGIKLVDLEELDEED